MVYTFVAHAFIRPCNVNIFWKKASSATYVLPEMYFHPLPSLPGFIPPSLMHKTIGNAPTVSPSINAHPLYLLLTTLAPRWTMLQTFFIRILWKQARKLQATLVRNSAQRLSDSLTGVKCRATSVAKNGLRQTATHPPVKLESFFFHSTLNVVTIFSSKSS